MFLSNAQLLQPFHVKHSLLLMFSLRFVDYLKIFFIQRRPLWTIFSISPLQNVLSSIFSSFKISMYHFTCVVLERLKLYCNIENQNIFISWVCLASDSELCIGYNINIMTHRSDGDVNKSPGISPYSCFSALTWLEMPTHVEGDTSWCGKPIAYGTITRDYNKLNVHFVIISCYFYDINIVQ